MLAVIIQRLGKPYQEATANVPTLEVPHCGSATECLGKLTNLNVTLLYLKSYLSVCEMVKNESTD